MQLSTTSRLQKRLQALIEAFAGIKDIMAFALADEAFCAQALGENIGNGLKSGVPAAGDDQLGEAGGRQRCQWNLQCPGAWLGSDSLDAFAPLRRDSDLIGKVPVNGFHKAHQKLLGG